ncbi:Gfo/Idh/MocA family oxidoreductase [Streptomyces sp. ME02-6987-2C]|uniref:Gfo/Idh/MocA family oxidoreductase n=1 Tax=unclassified Streptomyces TaxID=2593676 RepID=UPI0008793631|nr:MULTISPECIES: Gfo/Idh/MocA family oxidoreductase [unclassified Streptomyces]MDX3366438.1 Gfo/Idh/MocA family oxidoreductase [Streptomyces sp. ME02-6987-2C]MDX3423739.1 Gfo/Idh/MocA family oxidoreductase [Streptomyces sp. ME02-6985-2c]REH20637.1 oxidoreductase family protein [Streptomyces sp. 2221.1]SDT30923.1 Oxidoreductase family, NAD-binding Rossmann fold [Streptomyces sp. 2114.2]
MKNVLVIGVGPHARRSHLPALAAGQRDGLVGTACGVDVLGAASVLTVFDSDDGPRDLPVTPIEAFAGEEHILPGPVRQTLDGLVVRRGIDAVVVATEPAFHMVYARWALERGLSVLLDKPLGVRASASTDPAQAGAILTDVDDLIARYERARQHHPDVMVSVQSQRRYHPAFWRLRDLITEIAEATGCPVTSVQSFHSDGQWRLPDELLDLDYHGYGRGYGKCAHSGYHFFDIIPWLLAAGDASGKTADAVRVHAEVTRPDDLLAQLNVADYERLFDDFAARNRYTEAELRAGLHGFGEVDAGISMAFTSAGHTLTLATLNLFHNGFSQRGNFAPAAALYKGNGRVRQETHIIQQGPFQALHLHSLQTLENDSADDRYTVGGDRHIEVHVFRNNRFRPNWKPYTSLGHDDLTTTADGYLATPSQQSSRRRSMHEFLLYLNGHRDRHQMRSDLTTHRTAAALMAGTYLSMAHRFRGASPEATLSLAPTLGTLTSLARGQEVIVR